MKLIEMMNTSVPSKVADHLRNLSRQPDKLQAELKECNSSGMTSLHLAVSRYDLKMTRILLDFGASTKAIFSSKTVEHYAYDIAYESHFNPQQTAIYALLKSRREIEDLTLKRLRVSLPSLLQSISTATGHLHNAKNKIAILLLGMTGVGKSTLANFLYGIEYKSCIIEGVKQVKALQSEQVQTSGGTTSMTTFPQLVEPPKSRFVLIDLPGLEDTRGTIEEICAAASVCLLTKQLQGVQELLLVSSWRHLEDSRMVEYRQAAHNVGAMLARNHNTAKQLTLVITKGEADVKEEYVRFRLKNLCKDEGWDKVPIKWSEASKQEQMSPDEWAKQCIRRTTEAILSRKNNILLADVTSSTTRSDIQKYLAQLDSKPVGAEQFNFQCYSRYVERFQCLITSLQEYFAELESRRESFTALLQESNSLITEKDLEIKKLNAESVILQKKIKPFDAKLSLSAISACEATIKQIQLEESNIVATKKRDEGELERSRRSFINLEAKGTQSAIDKQLREITDEMVRLKLFGQSVSHLEQAKKELGDLQDIVDIQKNSIRKAITNTENSLQNYQRQLWDITNRLHEQKLQIVQHKQTMKNDQAVHESTISYSQKQIEMLNQRIAKLSLEKDTQLKKQEETKLDMLLIDTIKKVNQPLITQLAEITDIFASTKTAAAPQSLSLPTFAATRSVRIIPERKLQTKETTGFSLVQLEGMKLGLAIEQVKDVRFRGPVLQAVKNGIPFAEVINKSNDQIRDLLAEKNAQMVFR